MPQAYVMAFRVFPVRWVAWTPTRTPNRSAWFLVSVAGPSNPQPILNRVARGEPGAAEECIRRYGDLVWSVARRLSGGPLRGDVEDAVQEIFVDLWRSASRFDPGVASEPAFVVMIARRRLIDRIRRASRRPPPVQMGEAMEEQRSPHAPGPDSASRLADAEDATLALQALDSLSAEQQRCIRLAVQQGYTHTQIADATGLPLGTVKTHVRRGLHRVREAIEAKSSATVVAGRGA